MKNPNLIALFLSAALLFSCSTNQDTEFDPADINPELSTFEQKIFEKITKIAVASNGYWEGIPELLRLTPSYLIIEDPVTHGRQAFILNPNEPKFSGMTKMNSVPEIDFEIYKYNDAIDDVLMDLGEDDFSNFSGTIHYNAGYYSHITIRSLDKEVPGLSYQNTNDNFIPIEWIYNNVSQIIWTTQLPFRRPTSLLYETVSEGWSKELMAFQLLTLEMISDGYNASTEEEALNILKAYVSIRTKQMGTDIANQGSLTQRFSNDLESIDGPPRYVSYFVAKNSIFMDIDIDPSYGWRAFMDGLVDGEIDTTSVDYAVKFFSEASGPIVGGGIINALKILGVDVPTKLKNGETLFAMANKLLSLSSQELKQELEKAKTQYFWDDQLTRAEVILELIN